MTKKTFKFFLSIGMVFLLIFEISRAWTDFPKVRIIANVSKTHSNIFNLNDYLYEYAQFGYFTVISNIWMIIVIFLTWGLKFKIKSSIKVFSFTYMLITTIIFWIGIAPIMIWDQSAYFSFIMIYEHLFPTIVGWFLIRESVLDFDIKKQIVFMLIMPFVYLIFTIIMYAISKGQTVIYPFLHFFNFFYLNLGKLISIFLSILFLCFTTFMFIVVFIISSKFLKKQLINL